MFYKKILSLVLMVLIVSTVLIGTVSAAEVRVTRQVDDFEDIPGEEIEVETAAEALVSTESCGFVAPENKTYGAQVIAVRRKLRVEPGETFRIKVFMKNTGTMPWFSNNTNCLGPKMSLGTAREQDRASLLFNPEDTNWEGINRIGMDQPRIDPDEIASFTFWSVAPDEPDVLKEYFVPVLKNIQWIDDAEFYFELVVGDVGESPVSLRKKLYFANDSGSVADMDLDAEKLVFVDLSEQTMQLKLGDRLIRRFPVSTGASDTPTPVGETKILLKQEVRVSIKAPHYIMPKFQMYRAGGFGLHALPSLGNDGGVFWTEARNHMGRPVSHGCIRLLPEDADFAYEFTDVGTKVIVQR